MFYKEYVGEPLLSPFLTYPDLNNFYTIQVIELRYQVDHTTPKKFQLFEENRGATNEARLLEKLIRHRDIKMISDGKKLP